MRASIPSSPDPHQGILDELRRAALRASRRLSINCALRSGARWLPAPLAALALALLATSQFPELPRWLVTATEGLLAVPLLVGFRSLLKKRAPLLGASRLDVHHVLQNRVCNALEFGAHPPEERSALMSASILDAASCGPKLSPKGAVPFHFPRELLLSAGLACLIALIGQLEPPTTESPAPTASLPIAERPESVVELSPDDLELLAELKEELGRQMLSPETDAQAARLRQLVEDVSKRRLSKKQVFQRLEELEAKLQGSSKESEEALSAALKRIARNLEASRLSKPAGSALKENNLKDAEQALRDLARRLRSKPAKQSDLDSLRKALEAASQDTDGRLAQIEAERRRLVQARRRLLKKKAQEPAGDTTVAQQQAQASHERQLKRLDRQKRQTEQQRQELSALDRQLAKAAQELRKELGTEAAKALEGGADAMQQLQQRKLSNQEKRELKKQIEQLKEMLRRQKKEGKGGTKDQKDLLRKFQQAARGQRSANSENGKPGSRGQQGGNPGKLKLGLGAGRTVEVPGAPAPGTPTGAPGKKPAKPGSSSGQGWGSGSDENVQGEATELKGQTQDVAAAGIDSGEGAASSEVVYGAAQQGFRTKGYRQIYRDYQTVAEEVLEHDEIPPGHRAYIRRYFELIRPRQ